MKALLRIVIIKRAFLMRNRQANESLFEWMLSKCYGYIY